MKREVALLVLLQLCCSCHQTAAQFYRCGGTNTLPTGVITSPNHPSNYGDNENCTWTILMPTYYTGISLRFTAFDTESCCDFVEIRNGSSSEGTLIARFSGPLIPDDTISVASNSMWIRFTSNSSITRPGFRAEWYPRSTVCGATYTTSSGVITSPNYPSDYNNYDHCLWIIRVPSSNSGISLRFTAFRIEASVDVLEIRNGDTSSSPLINRYSSSMVPVTISITTNTLWIQFTSDRTITYSGFRAEWSPPSNDIGACGGTHTTSTGVITSSNHPSDYNNYDHCQWVIRMPSSYSGISLRFTAFRTELNPDILEIRNGSTPSSPLINRYSGSTIPATIEIMGNSMWLQFTTDRTVTYPGFRAEWSPLSNVCGGTYTTPTGVITSPNHPSNYNNNDNCTWIIRMPTSHAGISLRFTAFNTQLSYDIVEIRNGDTESSPLVNRYSGSTLPATVSVTRNNMWIQFTSDGSITYSGFRAEWSPRSSGIPPEKSESELN